MKFDRDEFRDLAKVALAERGYQITEEIQGRGIAPGAQLWAKSKEGTPVLVAVRASRRRRVGLTRLRDGTWKTVGKADLIVAVVPTRNSNAEAEIFGFAKASLVEAFDRALKAELREAPPPPIDVPFYVPLSRLKKIAAWTRKLPLASNNSQDIDQVQREKKFQNATIIYKKAAAEYLYLDPEEVIINVSIKSPSSGKQ